MSFAQSSCIGYYTLFLCLIACRFIKPPLRSIMKSPNFIMPTFTKTSPRVMSWTQIMKVADINQESCGQKQSRHVKMFATESVTSLWQTRLCRSNGILSITVHEESWWQSSRQSLRTLSCTQITKVSDMICVADFHDLCPRFYLQGSFSKSRKVGVMEFGLYQIYIAIPSLCSPAFNTYISVFYNAF